MKTWYFPRRDDFLWGRLLTCGRLAIGLLAVRKSQGGIYRPGWFSTLSPTPLAASVSVARDTPERTVFRSCERGMFNRFGVKTPKTVKHPP
jgi:hypothetical protein